jgi:streptogramin lyase
LFFSHDGFLWSTNYIGQNTAPGVPILSRYDKSKDQFVYVLDELKILQFPRELGSHIFEDKNGILWMFIKDPETNNMLSLYSFNPITSIAEKHPLQITTHFANLGIATDGQSIWTLDTSQGQLIQYFPSTQEIRPFDSFPSRGPDEPPVSLADILKQPLFVYYDDSKRIWLDNEGWLDFTDSAHPGYYKLIPSSVFIGYFESPQPKYGWLTTFDIFESSDGLIWFTTNGGIIRLDIRQGYEKGDWCLITNGYSQVKEDSQKNLWVIVFGKIYKYRFKP